MRLTRLLASWILVGTTLLGCSQPSVINQEVDQPSQSKGDAGIADHTMTMDLGPKDAEFDLRFIDGMILHHQGAVVMAESALQNSSRSEIKQLAEAIIAAQQGEIEQMQQWRNAWYPNASSDPVMYHAEMGHSMTMTPEMQAAMMMSGDLGKADAEFDLRFIDGMIPHHEGALDMAEQVLQNSDRPELQQLAQEILTTQQAEIDQMKQWKQDWYGQ
ncbi:MAG: DUF305 domain-containing protein [Leptolyngbyaceae bacterium]|nr:DUF305 domain-containing protein [Leptolyngbyaceae bacterium]